MKQKTVPCIVYRGGTSRGVFFKESDLPKSKNAQEQIFMSAIDAYNPSQVNGLGSGTSHTSKVIVIRETDSEEACLAYTFYQVGIGEAVVDSEGTCGNLMAAVGAYAIDEGFAKIPSADGMCEVTVLNENINRFIRIKVPVADGEAQVDGDYLMAGIVHTGAKISVSILSPAGGKTGAAFPADMRTQLKMDDRTIAATVSDIVNPFVFVKAQDFGLDGSEPNHILSQNQHLLTQLETLRLHGAVAAGMSETVTAAKDVPSIPKIALVAPPRDYLTASGAVVKAEDIDVIARMLSMGKFHRTFAGSGLYNLASALLIDGTIPNECCVAGSQRQQQKIRIGHPDGIAEVTVELTADGKDVAAVGLDRTARRILEGRCYVPGWL
ncbi:PrpF protein [Sporosarcina sp. P37]|uniref:PrpF domain-containing protein n=1 Tax=unclassified Sporosarcina TaxID=2647733 RepID=UPI000A17A868|nr:MULTISPECIES: PrpF domain-containing protein [unclassified Sporosarcina]ARK24446.1 PrpF protein [Sporosarcina sp. P37]PID18317.1 PrpF protein [Sporosarcina sp. P35]